MRLPSRLSRIGPSLRPPTARSTARATAGGNGDAGGVNRQRDADAAKARADELREDAAAARDRAAEHQRGTDEHLARGVNREGLDET